MGATAETTNERPLVTREQLLTMLGHVYGHEMSERQLRSWAAYGILPPPIRQRPPGKAQGKARALYPLYMVRVLNDLLDEALDGATIAELKERAPAIIARHAAPRPANNGSTLPPEDQASTAEERRRLRVPLALRRAAWDYAERYRAQDGQPIAVADVEQRAENGAEWRVSLRPPSDHDTPDD